MRHASELFEHGPFVLAMCEMDRAAGVDPEASVASQLEPGLAAADGGGVRMLLVDRLARSSRSCGWMRRRRRAGRRRRSPGGRGVADRACAGRRSGPDDSDLFDWTGPLLRARVRSYVNQIGTFPAFRDSGDTEARGVRKLDHAIHKRQVALEQLAAERRFGELDREELDVRAAGARRGEVCAGGDSDSALPAVRDDYATAAAAYRTREASVKPPTRPMSG